MKKLLGLMLFLSIAVVATAQNTPPLQGPAAKNAKPWNKKDISSDSEIVFEEGKNFLKGPQAKNWKPWQKEEKNDLVPVLVDANKKRVTGPKAKNRKPWQKPVNRSKVLYAKN